MNKKSLFLFTDKRIHGEYWTMRLNFQDAQKSAYYRAIMQDTGQYWFFDLTMSEIENFYMVEGGKDKRVYGI